MLHGLGAEGPLPLLERKDVSNTYRVPRTHTVSNTDRPEEMEWKIIHELQTLRPHGDCFP